MSGNSIETQPPQSKLRLQDRVSFRYRRSPPERRWMRTRRELPARQEWVMNKRRTVTCLKRSSAGRWNEFARGGSSKARENPFQGKPFWVDLRQVFRKILPKTKKNFREPD